MPMKEKRVTTELSRPSVSPRLVSVEILGDALIGIVGRAAGKLQTVIGFAFEPIVQILPRQPAAPADLQHLLEIGGIDAGRDERDGEQREDAQLHEEGVLVLVLERVEEIVAPEIEAHVEEHREQIQRDHRRQEAPGPFAIVGDEVRLGEPPGVAQKIEPSCIVVARHPCS
jgi:hypothetical protein